MSSVIVSGAAVGQVRAIAQHTPRREVKRSVHTPPSSWRGRRRKKHDDDLLVSRQPIREELQEPLFITDCNFRMEDPVFIYIYFFQLSFGLVLFLWGFFYFLPNGCFMNKLSLVLLIDLLNARERRKLTTDQAPGSDCGRRTRRRFRVKVRRKFCCSERVKEWRRNEGWVWRKEKGNEGDVTSESCRWLLRGSGEDLSACAVFKERDGTVLCC